MSKEPSKQDVAPDPEPATETRQSGRVTFDERGNTVWQWAVTTGETAIDGVPAPLETGDVAAPEDIAALLDIAALALADDLPPPSAVVHPNPKGVVQGYSPYDSGLLAKQGAARKRTDLRRLGEYIKLRRQVSTNKREQD